MTYLMKLINNKTCFANGNFEKFDWKFSTSYVQSKKIELFKRKGFINKVQCLNN